MKILELSKEIISSCCLSKDKMLSEELLPSHVFYIYNHIEETKLTYGSYDVYRMIVEEREDHLLEVRYAIYNGFVGAYITNKEESISRLIDERWHVPACRRGFKNYLRHKVLKTKDDFNFGMIPQQSRKDWMFDCDFRIVSFY